MAPGRGGGLGSPRGNGHTGGKRMGGPVVNGNNVRYNIGGVDDGLNPNRIRGFGGNVS